MTCPTSPSFPGPCSHKALCVCVCACEYVRGRYVCSPPHHHHHPTQYPPLSADGGLLTRRHVFPISVLCIPPSPSPGVTARLLRYPMKPRCSAAGGHASPWPTTPPPRLCSPVRGKLRTLKDGNVIGSPCDPAPPQSGCHANPTSTSPPSPSLSPPSRRGVVGGLDGWMIC